MNLDGLTLRQKQEVIDLIRRLKIKVTNEGQPNNVHVGLYIETGGHEFLIDEHWCKVLTNEPAAGVGSEGLVYGLSRSLDESDRIVPEFGLPKTAFEQGWQMLRIEREDARREAKEKGQVPQQENESW
jgi:hypothetical protein